MVGGLRRWLGTTLRSGFPRMTRFSPLRANKPRLASSMPRFNGKALGVSMRRQFASELIRPNNPTPSNFEFRAQRAAPSRF
jgi:hypothetical protein